MITAKGYDRGVCAGVLDCPLPAVSGPKNISLGCDAFHRGLGCPGTSRFAAKTASMEDNMRRIFIAAVALITLIAASAPSQACPAGYRPCGAGLCCPQ